MIESVRLPTDVSAPDFIIAAIGRSGSTMLANWLCRPPDRLVFVEPFFLHRSNPRLLRIQLDDFGMAADEEEWLARDETAGQRFERLMAPRLRGRRWAVKEVLCAEHRAMIDAFHPPKVVLCVRNIADVALSFLEKHRVQQNLDRFSDDWVRDYCVREAHGMIGLHRDLQQAGTSTFVVRYEDFTASADYRARIEEFTGWEGGGDVASHLVRFDRGFEIERHGKSISSDSAKGPRRSLPVEVQTIAYEIQKLCENYDLEFGYR